MKRRKQYYGIADLNPVGVDDDRHEGFDRSPDQLVQPIVRVELPHNTFVPDGAELIDIHNTVSVDPGDRDELISITSDKHRLVILQYVLASPDPTAIDQLFIPMINGKRVLKYHGRPTGKKNIYQIRQTLGSDLVANKAIDCQVYVNPELTFSIEVRNDSGGARIYGARIIGYAASFGIHTKRSIG